MISYGITDVGIRRKVNQDTVYFSDSSVGNLPNLYIVADGMGGELLLERTVDVAALGCHHQTACPHIQTVSQEAARIALAEDGGHGVAAHTTWDTEQARRLVDDNQVLVFINHCDVEAWLSEHLLGVGVDVESL